ncbi:MAG TPA: DoxX family protein [Egibacteraceae bacterium]|nr:DoxX family protein [Egibacteraceae bacterium]
MLLRRLARPLLASVFVTSGVDTLRNPEPRADLAKDVAPKIAEKVPALADLDTTDLVRLNGAVQVVAGSLLAINRVPRLASLALAASIVPTTAAGHRFWEMEEGASRKQQQIHFYKNLSILGGLLVAAADTEGRPGVGWRTEHAAKHAGAAVERGRRRARRAARTAGREAKATAKAARREAKLAAKSLA